MEECLFCAMHDSSINRVLVQNKTCYARYDNFPVSDGHVEVVTKRHVISFLELTQEELCDVFDLIKLVAKGSDGYTIGINEGRAAGRTVDHVHVHVIPRRFGDVADPRGGVRNVLPSCSPDAWK